MLNTLHLLINALFRFAQKFDKFFVCQNSVGQELLFL